MKKWKKCKKERLSQTQQMRKITLLELNWGEKLDLQFLKQLNDKHQKL